MFLDEIARYKREEVALSRLRLPLDALLSRVGNGPFNGTRRFTKALSAPPRDGLVHIIAEIKRASPSRGMIRPDLDPVDMARSYQTHGASAISVLTETRYFLGDPGYIAKVKGAVDLPVLRKDFIVDPYQIFESKLLGADAILIIARLVGRELEAFVTLAHEIGLECLVEVHSKDELLAAIDTPARVIGINNRDLETFSVDLAVTFELAPLVPRDRVIVSESGIWTSEHVEMVARSGVNAILVGESLMRAADVGKQMRSLKGLPAARGIPAASGPPAAGGRPQRHELDPVKWGEPEEAGELYEHS
ncbi:MAG TPA: indole-3-glycerol phosphate synthase TrpC [Firmicutes bacterium]|nr:indole-3-glycerol phosphate synthase TrpC [Bacillota bacterium]